MTATMAGKWKMRIFGLLLAAMVSYTALPQCANSVSSFQAGEKLNYQLLYTWGFIWIHAADAQFSVTSQKIGATPAYLLTAKASSVKTFDWFFKVRDSFQSLVISEKFTPVWFEQNTSEGGWDVHQTYSFDPSGRQIFHKGKIGRRAPVNDTVNVPACTFDVLSAIYYCRTIAFEKYKVNDKLTVNTLIDGKLYPIQFKFLGRETISGLHRKEKYRCYKIEATAIESTNFEEGQKIFVWITDDDNHLPILIEAKVVVGSIKGYLDTFEGLKHSLKSKIETISKLFYLMVGIFINCMIAMYNIPEIFERYLTKILTIAHAKETNHYCWRRPCRINGSGYAQFQT